MKKSFYYLKNFKNAIEILDQLRQNIEESSIDSSHCLKLIDDLEILD